MYWEVSDDNGLIFWVNLLVVIGHCHMKNNLPGIYDKQQSSRDALALMLATANRYLSLEPDLTYSLDMI